MKETILRPCCGFHAKYTSLQASAMPCGVADWGQVLIQVEGKTFNLFGVEMKKPIYEQPLIGIENKENDEQ